MPPKWGSFDIHTPSSLLTPRPCLNLWKVLFGGASVITSFPSDHLWALSQDSWLAFCPFPSCYFPLLASASSASSIPEAQPFQLPVYMGTGLFCSGTHWGFRVKKANWWHVYHISQLSSADALFRTIPKTLHKQENTTLARWSCWTLEKGNPDKGRIENTHWQELPHGHRSHSCSEG